MIREDDPRFRITPFQQMASACTGALITSLFMTPLDVVKIRLQAQQKALLSNKCYLYCNGLMEHICPCGETGLVPRRVHFQGTMGLGWLNQLLMKINTALKQVIKYEGYGGLFRGLGSTLLRDVPFSDSKLKQKASNMQDIARNIYKNHGIKGMFTGLLPRIFKVAPACAIMIATFEYGKQFFQTYNTQKYKEKMQR
ncbi:hypothetical protein MSG28_007997 [Choristoneura fumiferana]|nr:hypothetical protein MSG28_007997 [Choristoneura fumiferana]